LAPPELASAVLIGCAVEVSPAVAEVLLVAWLEATVTDRWARFEPLAALAAPRLWAAPGCAVFAACSESLCCVCAEVLPPDSAAARWPALPTPSTDAAGHVHL
jgi:hypothetical protein